MGLLRVLLAFLLTDAVVSTLSMSQVLYWNGGSPTCVRGSCPNGSSWSPGFLCSTDPGFGNKEFSNPLSEGALLTQVGIQLNGQFQCNKNLGPPQYYLTISNALISYGVLPRSPSNLNCSCSNCYTTFSANSSVYPSGLNGYNYQGSNTFSLILDPSGSNNNTVCLTSATLILYYTILEIDLYQITPSSGPREGNTQVSITGSGFLETDEAVCRFGETETQALWINSTLINCTTPPMQTAGPVTVTVTFFGFRLAYSNLTYTYTDAVPTTDTTESGSHPFKPSSTTVEWILIGAGLALLLILALLLFVIQRYYNRAYLNDDGESSSLLAGAKGSDIRPIAFSEIALMERIGRGNYGEVFKASWRGTIVAVKKAKLEKSDEKNKEFLEDLIKEASIMRKLRHPNVLQFLGLCENAGEICILTEYMPRGSLYRLLHDKKTVIDPPLLKRILLDIAKGMNYLHHEGVIHRDLKSHNLLVGEHWTVKVCDFGLSRMFQNTAMTQAMTSCGTPCWTAPEVLRNDPYSEKCDVYSFAIVLWELLTREDPYSGMPPFQVVFAVATQGVRPEVPGAPPALARMMTDCWAENAKSRPDFGRILSVLDSDDLFLEMSE